MYVQYYILYTRDSSGLPRKVKRFTERNYSQLSLQLTRCNSESGTLDLRKTIVQYRNRSFGQGYQEKSGYTWHLIVVFVTCLAYEFLKLLEINLEYNYSLGGHICSFLVAVVTSTVDAILVPGHLKFYLLENIHLH